MGRCLTFAQTTGVDFSSQHILNAGVRECSFDGEGR